ncbi:TerS protein [Massilia eurypsychrophila]|uniref:TerS protein n=2 Tax=Massilia eurypsychrophila TaxID=1485217 RepID=A0A2G8T7C9_9BURK|nr:TerS protein [Massilia eurypsychrophila]
MHSPHKKEGEGTSKPQGITQQGTALSLRFNANPRNADKMTAPKTKRTRADSAASAVNAMVAAAKPDIAIPDYVTLTDSAIPFWAGVVRARARDEWIDVDLVVAAQLAQCQADIAEEDALLRAEGRVMKNDKGTQIMNPRTTVMEQLARREMALMRTLRMGGRIAGDTRDEAGKRKIERESRKLRGELEEEDDGLLAT